jgi:hypothetical protein
VIPRLFSIGVLLPKCTQSSASNNAHIIDYTLLPQRDQTQCTGKQGCVSVRESERQ